jgi:hypothetical protein
MATQYEPCALRIAEGEIGLSAAEAGREHGLALLGALPALALGTAEEVRELLVAVAFCVLHVML